LPQAGPGRDREGGPRVCGGRNNLSARCVARRGMSWARSGAAACCDAYGVGAEESSASVSTVLGVTAASASPPAGGSAAAAVCLRPRRSLLDGAAAARCQGASTRPARRGRFWLPPAQDKRILRIHPGNMRELWAAPQPNRGDVRAMPMPAMPCPGASYAQRQRALSSRPVRSARARRGEHELALVPEQRNVAPIPPFPH